MFSVSFVSNTGDVDADDAVLGFLTPPGAGKDGVPLQTLLAYVYLEEVLQMKVLILS